MIDQNLLTFFIALTSVAILIQTGILVGFYFLTTKLTRQADRAVDSTRNLLRPAQAAAEGLQSVSARLVELGSLFPGWWGRRARQI